MAFALERFQRAEFKPRTQKVLVDGLADFFDEGEKPEWEVRGLNSAELHQAMEAHRRQTDIGGIVKAISANGDMAQTVRKVLGLSGDTPGEVAKRLEMLVMGSVAPQIDLPTAVKLAEAFPIEFLTLTNEITVLTGKGYDLVKPGAASKKTQVSAPA